jgi:hypothetical protein
VWILLGAVSFLHLLVDKSSTLGHWEEFIDEREIDPRALFYTESEHVNEIQLELKERRQKINSLNGDQSSDSR